MGDQRHTEAQKEEGGIVSYPLLDVSTEAAVLNDVSHEIGTWAQGHGFREDWDFASYLEGLAVNIERGVVFDDDEAEAVASNVRKAAEALRTNYLGMKLMLIVSEAAEALETLRDHGASGVLAGEGNFGEEVADIHIRGFDLSQLLKSPVGDIVLKKMAVNAERPYKHGRKA